MKLICSDPECGDEILGSICVVADAGEDDEGMAWGSMMLYPSTTGPGFLLLHPNCFKGFQDELLRQERGAVIHVALGKVEDVREALQLA
jgi:hypothetical protein